MADVCCQYTFGSVTLNPADESTDHLRLMDDGMVGLDSRPVRRQRDPASRTDGAIVFHAYFHGRVIQVKALMVIGTTGHEDGLTAEYLTAYNTLEAAIVSALEGLVNTPTNLSWTPTGGSPQTLSCVYGADGSEVTFTGPMIARVCEFTLVEASAIIS